MFFHISLTKNIQIHPRSLGPNLRTTLTDTLHNEVEGTCSGRWGFIVMVTGIEKISKGRIMDGTGSVTFTVIYKAIVFRPFKGEVLDAVVTGVNKMGFMAEVGPLQVFVSKSLIPSDYTYDVAEESYVSEDQRVKITKDEDIRIKIVGLRVDAGEIFAVGTIKEDYLGC